MHESKEEMFVSKKDLAQARERISFFNTLVSSLHKASEMTFNAGIACHMQPLTANTNDHSHDHFSDSNEINDPVEFFNNEAGIIKSETEKLISELYALRKQQSFLCNHLEVSAIMQCLATELKKTVKDLHECIEIETMMSELRDKY